MEKSIGPNRLAFYVHKFMHATASKGWRLVTGSVTEVLARRPCDVFNRRPIKEQSTRTAFNPLFTSLSATLVCEVFGAKVVDANPPSNAAIASPRTRVNEPLLDSLHFPSCGRASKEIPLHCSNSLRSIEKAQYHAPTTCGEPSKVYTASTVILL